MSISHFIFDHRLLNLQVIHFHLSQTLLLSSEIGKESDAQGNSSYFNFKVVVKNLNYHDRQSFFFNNALLCRLSLTLGSR